MPNVLKKLRLKSTNPLRTKVGIFVRSGGISVANGSLGYFGIVGHNWSGTVANYADTTSSNTTAYYLNFSASGVNPSVGPYNRLSGLPVRCLV